jgi:hypothetical protein
MSDIRYFTDNSVIKLGLNQLENVVKDPYGDNIMDDSSPDSCSFYVRVMYGF